MPRCKATEPREQGLRQCTGIEGHEGPHFYSDGPTSVVTLEQIHFETHAARHELLTLMQMQFQEIADLRKSLDSTGAFLDAIFQHLQAEAGRQKSEAPARAADPSAVDVADADHED